LDFVIVEETRNDEVACGSELLNLFLGQHVERIPDNGPARIRGL